MQSPKGYVLEMDYLVPQPGLVTVGLGKGQKCLHEHPGDSELLSTLKTPVKTRLFLDHQSMGLLSSWHFLLI